MRSIHRNIGLDSLAFLFSLSLPTSTRGQDVCRAQSIAVYEQAVSINTNAFGNTTFYPIPQVPLTISNAPTSIDELTTLRWTSVHAVYNTAQPTDVTDPNSFVLLGKAVRFGQKRQASEYEYITASGTTTSDCTQAIRQTLSNGMLTTVINGATYYYSASAGTTYQKFVPSTLPNALSTTFSLQTNNEHQFLTWSNPSFYNGEAYFCSTSDGTIYAVFQYNAQPSGCLYFQLVLYSSSTCQAASSGPSGPSDKFSQIMLL